MATAGAKNKPDNVHKLQGTYRKDRHGNADEKIQINDPIGDPPEFLSEVAQAEWKRIVGVLSKARVLTKGDAAVLSQYCILWAELVRLGENFTASKHSQLRLCCNELGLTPSARSRMPVGKTQPPGAFDDF